MVKRDNFCVVKRANIGVDVKFIVPNTYHCSVFIVVKYADSNACICLELYEGINSILRQMNIFNQSFCRDGRSLSLLCIWLHMH